MTKNILIRPALVAALVLAGCAATPQSDTAAQSSTAEFAALAPPTPSTTPVAPGYSAAAKALDAELRRNVAAGGLARADGYVYSQDVAMALLYAARRGDAELYTALLPAAHSLILQNENDPYTGGFVLVRTREGAKPVATGAAEALWMARALWTGAQAFGRAEDRTLALAVLDGYAKHAYTLQGVWLARRGFDFGDRSFANLSALPAYQPDFLAEAEKQASRTEWRGFADRSYKLIERTATPSRLLLPVIQPEVGANYPGAGLDVYAPNGMTSLEDSCFAAEGAARGLPKVANGLLDFVVEKAARSGGRLHAFYGVEDGAAIGETPLSPAGYACLDRLAMARGHEQALALADARLTTEMQLITATKGKPQPAIAALLLAAQARGAF